MRKLTTAVFCVLFTLTGLAQNNDYNDNFFMSFHSTAYFDFIWSPLKLENAPTGNTIIDGNGNEVPEYKEIPFQSYTNNLFSFGVEPRYNIHTIDNNTAVAVSSPISIGLGQVGQSPFISHRVGSVEGFGSIQIPLFLKLYIGSGSTYDCEKDYGVSLGAGFEYNKVGLIQLNNDVASDINTGFVLPVLSFGFHFFRGFDPVEFNLKYGSGRQVEYFNDANGDPITTAGGVLSSAFGRSRVVRASISYILNY